jgi:AbrB family looped-hinge helix DNA binding protein
MQTARVTSKGQITIPVEVRRALGLETGSEIYFIEGDKGEYIVRPSTGSIWDLRGCVPRLDHVVTLEEMDEGIAAAVAEEYFKSVGGRVGGVSRHTDDEAA